MDLFYNHYLKEYFNIGKHAYLPSCQDFDKKIDRTRLYSKQGATASSRLA